METKNYAQNNIRSFIIDNITDKDLQHKKLRIKTAGKFLFPDEISGEPQKFDLTIQFSEERYPCTYQIGSKDGKSRSGVLNLRNIFKKLDLRVTDNLMIELISELNYSIKKL